MRLGGLPLFAVMCLVAACGTLNREATDPSQGAAVESAAAPMALGPQPVDSQELSNDIIPGSPEEFLAEIGDRVFFTVDDYDLTAAARETLQRQAAWLQRHPSRRIVIQGHADERGTREYNLALGDLRANAVRNYLVAVGIDPSRVTTVSYGKELPASTEATETAWAQNRRGVTLVE